MEDLVRTTQEQLSARSAKCAKADQKVLKRVKKRCRRV